MAGRQTLKLKLEKGDTIGGRYVIVRKLGEGGCGAVWLCRHVRRADEFSAIKVLENSHDEKRFKRERSVMEKAQGSFVVKLLDSGRHEGHPYMVLEYMDGGSLRDLMDRQKRIPPREAAWAALMAVRGLKWARLVHRDLKPENLLLTKPRGGEVRLVVNDFVRGTRVKVADFGLAKPLDQDMKRSVLTQTGQIMGTPLYMSPEQCRNTRDVDFRSDIYSLGVILYEMVVGQPPFDGQVALDIMNMHCQQPVPWPKNMDPEIKAVLVRCLEKEPDKRYRSLRALEQDLSAIAQVEAEPDSRLGWKTTLLLFGGMALVAALAWVLRERLWQQLRHLF